MSSKALIITLSLIGLLLSGCLEQKEPTAPESNMVYDFEGQNVVRIHDNSTAVTCWLVRSGDVSYNTAISCFPDNQLR